MILGCYDHDSAQLCFKSFLCGSDVESCKLSDLVTAGTGLPKLKRWLSGPLVKLFCQFFQ